MRYCGRYFRAAEIELISAFLTTPRTNRVRLSQETGERLGWRRENDALKVMICRDAPRRIRPMGRSPYSVGRAAFMTGDGVVLPSMKEATNMTIYTGHKWVAMSVNVAEFKSKCLKLIDQVAVTRESLVITKRGKPMAKLVPIDNETPTSLFGYMKNTGQILGDVVDVPHELFAVETGEEDDLYAGFKPKTKS